MSDLLLLLFCVSLCVCVHVCVISTSCQYVSNTSMRGVSSLRHPDVNECYHYLNVKVSPHSNHWLYGHLSAAHTTRPCVLIIHRFGSLMPSLCVCLSLSKPLSASLCASCVILCSTLSFSSLLSLQTPASHHYSQPADITISPDMASQPPLIGAAW